MTTVFSSLQYGYDLIFWVTIEGVPVVWTEYVVGKTLPAGYTDEVAALVIDDSAEIGSEVNMLGGVGKSLPLSFRLRDTATTREFFQRYAYDARLSADLTAAATTISVESTGSFPSSGALYIGNERVSYTGKTATTFTGCTRGVAGYAYAHKAGGSSGVVTDLPRWWRGREVQLWATPVDPTGYVAGGSLSEDAQMIWRGHIEHGPRRENLHFAFDAMALDRRLARPIGRKFAGRIVDTDTRYAVSKALIYRAYITIRDSNNASTFNDVIAFEPFAADADGAMLTGTEIRARMTSAYEAAVSAGGHGGTLDSLIWVKKGFTGVTDPAMSQVIYVAHFSFDADAAARSYRIVVTSTGNQVTPEYVGFVAGFTAGQAERSFWVTTDNPFRLTSQGAQPLRQSATIALIDGDPAAAPSSGVARVGDETFYYQQAAAVQGLLYLGWMTKLDASGYGSLKPGVDVSIVASDGTIDQPVDPAAAAHRMIASSGTPGLRSAQWDTLGELQGYGLDEDMVDHDSITQVFYSGALGQLRLQFAADGQSFEDLFGGLLQLSQRAVVMRANSNNDNKSGLVAVDLGHSTNYATEIDDNALITTAQDPVAMEYASEWPNRVEISVATLEQEATRFVFVDRPAVAAQGGRTLEVEVPALKPDGFMPAAQVWSMQLLQGAQSMQLMTLRVVPWVKCEVGESALIDITHPAVWDWAQGKPGYTGPGVCIGRHVTPKTGETRLKFIVSGIVNRGALCPSAAVLATDNATNPTQIDVDLKYLAHFSNAITAASGGIRLLHYRPGQAESVAEGYDISAAAKVGSICRLTVASKIGTPTLTANTPAESDSSHLTLPESANDDAFQALFMHDADGSKFA